MIFMRKLCGPKVECGTLDWCKLNESKNKYDFEFHLSSNTSIVFIIKSQITACTDIIINTYSYFYNPLQLPQMSREFFLKVIWIEMVGIESHYGLTFSDASFNDIQKFERWSMGETVAYELRLSMGEKVTRKLKLSMGEKVTHELRRSIGEVTDELRCSMVEAVAYELRMRMGEKVTYELRLSMDEKVAHELRLSIGEKMAHKLRLSIGEKVAHELRLKIGEKVTHELYQKT